MHPVSESVARTMRPDGPLAQLCALLAAAREPSDPDTLYNAGVALLLRLVFARLAAARGLLPAALAPAPNAGAALALRRLGEGAKRGDFAPGAFTIGGLLDSAGGEESLDPAGLAAVVGELDQLVGAAAPVRLLGDVYEQTVARRLVLDNGQSRLATGSATRGTAGVYFTPQPLLDEIVRAVVERTLAERLSGANATAMMQVALALRVCDPAMGSGHFLVCAARRIAALAAESLARAGAPTDEGVLLRDVASCCLFGADVHPLAADLARLSVWLECSAPDRPVLGLGERLLCGESLLGIDWPAALPEVFAVGGFDAVVGNPPWGADLRGVRGALRAHYHSAHGEVESAALFTELALRLCQDGGRVGLVTPNTWLTLVRSARLRQFVHNTGELELVAEHPAGTFVDAPSIVPLVFVVRRRAADRERVDPSSWRSDPGGISELRLSGAARRVLARVEAAGSPLGEVAAVAYGIKTGDNAANLADSPRDASYVPALADGSEVRRYAIRWGGRFLRYGPHLAGYRRTPVAVPKIVVQYIRSLALPRRLVAAVDAEGVYYPLNNFSYIGAPAAYDLHYVAALLCSRLLDALFAARFRDYNIKPAYLRRLPVARVAFTTPRSERTLLCERLVGLRDTPEDALALADELLATGRDDVVHDGLALLARRLGALHALPGAPDALARADTLCEQIVTRLYGVSDDEALELEVRG